VVPVGEKYKSFTLSISIQYSLFRSEFNYQNDPDHNNSNFYIKRNHKEPFLALLCQSTPKIPYLKAKFLTPYRSYAPMTIDAPILTIHRKTFDSQLFFIYDVLTLVVINTQGSTI
jgi:hypothetical protein